jgi:hypothetical protein
MLTLLSPFLDPAALVCVDDDCAIIELHPVHDDIKPAIVWPEEPEVKRIIWPKEPKKIGAPRQGSETRCVRNHPREGTGYCRQCSRERHHESYRRNRERDRAATKDLPNSQYYMKLVNPLDVLV